MEIGIINIGGGAAPTHSYFFFFFPPYLLKEKKRTEKSARHAHRSAPVLKLFPTPRCISHLPMKTHYMAANHHSFARRESSTRGMRRINHEPGDLFSCEIFNICLICLNGPIYKVCSVFRGVGGRCYCERSSKSSSFCFLFFFLEKVDFLDGGHSTILCRGRETAETSRRRRWDYLLVIVSTQHKQMRRRGSLSRCLPGRRRGILGGISGERLDGSVVMSLHLRGRGCSVMFRAPDRTGPLPAHLPPSWPNEWTAVTGRQIREWNSGQRPAEDVPR